MALQEKELKLDWDTVKALDKEYMEKQLRRKPVAASHVIGIDEISLRKGHIYRIVISDLERYRPIWYGGKDRSEDSLECMKLMLHNFNLDAGILTVHGGKGKKDRTVPLSKSIILQIKNHITYVMELHQKDIDAGYAGAFFDGLLEKKYKNIGKELIWQWFFPARTLACPR